MRILLNLPLTLLFIILSLTTFSQEKQELHHRARIFFNSSEQAEQLNQLGIEMDHGLIKKDVFIESDYSVSELMIISNAGFEYEILIDDVAKFYVDQNAKPAKSDLNKNADCNGSSGTSYPKPANFNLGSMGGFFTYEEIQAQLDLMATLYPNLISAKSPISTFQTYEGRSIYWLKISDNPNVDEAEPEILYDAIHHAREPASVASLLYYMWYLLENYDSDSEIKAIVDNTELYFVPLVNPDGYRYNQITNPNGGGLWRKNRRDHGNGNFGVDNNRNYGVEWGTTGISFNTASDVYPGTAAFSEPENQAMKWFTENHDFKIAYNNHTSGNLLLYPFGYQENQPTPDDALYQQISAEMVSNNGFNNIISADLYPASGDSDDWMYTATPDKPKILAFTPEIGGSGFWPASSEIISICQSTMYMNLSASHMVSKYAKISEESALYINGSGSFDFDIQRLGLEGGSFIVELLPAVGNTYVSSTSSPQTINLNLLESQTVNTSFTLNSGVPQGAELNFDLHVDNGDFIQIYTINKVFGAENILFFDGADDLTQWSTTDWATTSATFQTGPNSMTDSPGGEYSNNTNSTITILNNLDLTDVTAADLSFYAKWDIEAGWDYVQVEVSTDGGTWIPQCGIHTKPGNNNQATGEPLYDGTQNDWVLENISLSDYIGLNVKIRFQIVTDGFVTADGFYFDDVKISTLGSAPASLDLSAKVMMQGPYSATDGLMIDALRSNALLPLNEPYTGFGYNHSGNGGGETTTSSVMAVTGSDAIVDWIIVEIRDAASPTNVLESRSALIQRDGDIVAMDGLSPLQFDGLSGDILVALRHRNHYGVRSLNPSPGAGAVSVDFTNPSFATFGNDPMILIDGQNMLFAADANGDGQVNSVDNNLFWRPENGSSYDYSTIKADFNLDGTINTVDKNILWRGNNGVKSEQLD